MPRTAMTVPTTIRRRDDSSWSPWWSARAATGGIRTARRAGLMADTTVTPTPTTRAAMTVRDSKTRGPVGRVMPNPLSRASRPRAASTPSPRPISEATSPSRPASTSTERKTWRRLAPTIRSRASSRVRWPTRIEKVLKMVNPPTNSEMKANTSSAVEKKDSAWLIELVCSLATVWPVTTSTPGGRTPGDGPLDARPCRHPVWPGRRWRRSARPRRTASGRWAGRRRPAWPRPGCRRCRT